jgi:sulfonate transport system substrate-binding protein
MKTREMMVAALLVIATGISGCNNPPNNTSNPNVILPVAATGEKKVNIGSFSVAVDYAPYLIAKKKGWFDEALAKKGFKASYTAFQSLPPINESLATGKVDFMFEAEPAAIIGEAAGIDLKIVGISCYLIQEILVPNDSPIKQASQLKGKTIAVLAGTSSHYGLLKMIGKAGLKPSDINVVNMVPPDAKNAFETKKVDGWAVWPPFVEQEEISGKGRKLPKGDAVINSIMAVRSKFSQENPGVVKDMVAVLQRSKEWIIKNPAEAQEIVATEINVPLNVVKKSWPSHNWAAKLTPVVGADIQSKANFLKDNSFIKRAVDVKTELIDTSYSAPEPANNIVPKPPVNVAPTTAPQPAGR